LSQPDGREHPIASANTKQNCRIRVLPERVYPRPPANAAQGPRPAGSPR